MAWNWKAAMDAAGESASPGGADISAAPAGASGEPTSPTRTHGPGPTSVMGLADRQRRAGILWQPRDGEVATVSASDASRMLLHAEERPCVFCGGRGRASGGLCPVCNGRGSIQVRPPVVSCAFCRGRAKMPPNSNLTCWVCNGKGVVAVIAPIEQCPDCHGRGRRRCESLPCPRCRGVGVVTVPARDANAGGST